MWKVCRWGGGSPIKGEPGNYSPLNGPCPSSRPGPLAGPLLDDLVGDVRTGPSSYRSNCIVDGNWKGGSGHASSRWAREGDDKRKNLELQRAPCPRREAVEGTDDVAHELLGRRHLDLEDRLQEHPARRRRAASLRTRATLKAISRVGVVVSCDEAHADVDHQGGPARRARTA